MPSRYFTSHFALVSLIFLLPLFFIPGGSLDLGNTKALLLVLGFGIATLLFLAEIWKGRELVLPKHRFLIAAALLPAIYLLSALLSTPSSLSLLGYNLEPGTFGSILIGVALLALTAIVFTDVARALNLVLALFGSLALLAVFVTIKILSGGSWLSFGGLSGNMANPLGGWTDLGMVFGLLAVISALALGLVPAKRSFKIALFSLFILSTALLAVIHFSSALTLSLIASVLLWLYFTKIESRFPNDTQISKPTLLPIALGVVSLIFLVNPVLSGGRHLGEIVSGYFGVSNAEVHPTLSSTLSISKAVLSKEALFGSGPNTFGHDWLIYKPAEINATPFWGVEFPFGAGFIPTQISTTGVIGSIIWLAFFILLIWLAVRILCSIPDNRMMRFALVTSLVTSLFLWAAGFLYSPSSPVLIITFVFTGLMLALAYSAGILAAYRATFSALPARPMARSVVALLVCGVLFLGWQEGKKALGAFHFKRAVDLSSVVGTSLDAISRELEQAVEFAPLDTYYIAISRLNFSKAVTIASSATGTPEENRIFFEQALGTSIEAAKSAVSANPAGYVNWVVLGQIYSSLVPEPLKIEGAYESAQFVYNEALKRNPSNPDLFLLLSQLEINKGNLEAARSYLRSALALKEDYADTYVLLARLEVSANNIPAAILSAEKLSALSPENAGIHFEVGLLKYSALNYRGALLSFEKALTISPDYANAKYYLALSLAKLGRKDEAREHLVELSITNPGNAELKTALDSLK